MDANEYKKFLLKRNIIKIINSGAIPMKMTEKSNSSFFSLRLVVLGMRPSCENVKIDIRIVNITV